MSVKDVHRAIDLSDNQNLAVSMALAFACGMRIGEILGLTWDCVDISEKAMRKTMCSLFVNKELQRVNTSDIILSKENDRFFSFPSVTPNSKSILVLKLLRTTESVRRIMLPNTVVEKLRHIREAQDEMKSFLGDEYTDYNMVISRDNGNPIEHRIIHKAFEKLLTEHGFPKASFHSLRHSILSEFLAQRNELPVNIPCCTEAFRKLSTEMSLFTVQDVAFTPLTELALG